MTLDQLRSLDINDIGSWPLLPRYLLLAVIVVAVLAFGWWYESREQLPLLDEVRAKEEGLKAEVASKAAKAANLEAYKQQLEEMKQSFGAMLRQLPNKTQVAELLVDISQTGLASGLEFELFKPQGEIPRDFYAELPISIRVTGQYHDFGAFVSGVAALPRIVTVHDITIKPVGAAPGQTSEQLAMEMTAKTYRYIDEEEQAAASAAAKPEAKP
jgi:type IV pilus assembly protein PilO